MYAISRTLHLDGACLDSAPEKEVDFHTWFRTRMEQQVIPPACQSLRHVVLEKHPFVDSDFVVKHRAQQLAVNVAGTGHRLGEQKSRVKKVAFEQGIVEIHLKTEIPMDRKTKDELLSVSSSGKNSASKGLIGKIRDMISTLTLPEDPEMKILTDQALGMMSFGCQMGTHYGDAYTWSMNAYVASINKESSGAEEEKDELEKSIVGNLADEVKVSITGSKVEVVIYKAF